jgi:hypothetical protein
VPAQRASFSGPRMRRLLIVVRNAPSSDTALSFKFSSQANSTRTLRAHAVTTPEANQANAK